MCIKQRTMEVIHKPKNIDVEGDSGTSGENTSSLVCISKQNYMISFDVTYIVMNSKVTFFKLY